jgi:biotin synthase
MRSRELRRWLAEDDELLLRELWQRADEVRRTHVGDEVHLRGRCNFSNYCVRQCTYCGLRAGNRALTRYRLTEGEVLDCAAQAARLGYGTLVLQSGEDLGYDAAWLGGIVRRIKDETLLAVTLSVGERDEAELAAWREAGADRYFMRFETSNPELYRSIHPSRPGRLTDRVALLERVRALGYQVGSGIMVGIPGQTIADLAADLELLATADFDMIGVGPFVPHPATPLGQRPPAPGPAQAPATALMTFKVLALARLLCPRAHLPVTTALAALDPVAGRELGLRRGGNVVMPDLTPLRYRHRYEIYPGQAGSAAPPDVAYAELSAGLALLGRPAGAGRGDALGGHAPATSRGEP